jgi:DNA-binding NarL/FixJ family response regulator
MRSPHKKRECAVLNSLVKSRKTILKGPGSITLYGGMKGAVMIDVIIADHKELFHVGLAEILAGTGDVCLVQQPRSPDQLVRALKTITPNVLVLSTSFLPAFSKIEPLLKRSHTGLLVLAEENDRTAYVRWWRAQGVVYRSMNVPVLVDAMRRVARGELFIQDGSCDASEETPELTS